MTGKRAQGTIELSEPPGKTPGDDAAGASPLGGRLGRRVFRPRNAVSFLLALAVLYLVYQQLLDLDWREAWANVRGASTGLFVFALAVFYCSFPLRALRWKALLGNVGYSRAAGRPMPSALGLTRIMYIAWFANCVTVARLGDAYRGYLLKKEAGVSFAVTLGTILAERLLDLLVLAAMMGWACSWSSADRCRPKPKGRSPPVWSSRAWGSQVFSTCGALGGRSSGSCPNASTPTTSASSTASSARSVAGSRCSSPSPRPVGSSRGRHSTQRRHL